MDPKNNRNIEEIELGGEEVRSITKREKTTLNRANGAWGTSQSLSIFIEVFADPKIANWLSNLWNLQTKSPSRNKWRTEHWKSIAINRLVHLFLSIDHQLCIIINLILSISTWWNWKLVKLIFFFNSNQTMILFYHIWYWYNACKGKLPLEKEIFLFKLIFLAYRVAWCVNELLLNRQKCNFSSQSIPLERVDFPLQIEHSALSKFQHTANLNSIKSARWNKQLNE